MNASSPIPLQLTKQELLNLRVAYCKQLDNIEKTLDERGHSHVCLLSAEFEAALCEEKFKLVNRLAEIDAEANRVASLE